jgi:hypothetical protein
MSHLGLIAPAARPAGDSVSTLPRSRHHFTAGARPRTGQHQPLEFPVAVATSERGKGNREKPHLEGIAMRRLGVIVALGALLGLFAGVLTASPALAGRRHGWELVQAQPFTVPKLFCGFRIRVTFPVNREFTKLFKASDGSMITLVSGSLRFTFTNLSTGKAVTENVSGPGKIISHADGSATIAAKGRNGDFLTPAQAKRFGLPMVSVTAGALTTTVAADGRETSVTLKGHVLVNVCAALT